MAIEREIRTAQEDKLILLLKGTKPKERDRLIELMEAKAKSGMTKEEIAEVKERVFKFLQNAQ